MGNERSANYSNHCIDYRSDTKEPDRKHKAAQFERKHLQTNAEVGATIHVTYRQKVHRKRR